MANVNELFLLNFSAIYKDILNVKFATVEGRSREDRSTSVSAGYRAVPCDEGLR